MIQLAALTIIIIGVIILTPIILPVLLVLIALVMEYWILILCGIVIAVIGGFFMAFKER